MQKTKLGIVTLVAIAVCAAICACGSTEKTPLPAPQNVHAEQRELVWDEVKNAAGYVVRYLNTEYETSENRYDLSELTEPNTYEIKVLAIGDNKNNVDSEWTTYSYTVIEPVEHGYDESGLEYTLLADGTGYEVSRGKHKLFGVVEIPDYYYTLPVKRIANEAFFFHSGIEYPNPITGNLCNIATTGIRLPSRLETIGEYAFSCMIKLTEVEIPETVTQIERHAFNGCKSIKRIKLPRGLKVITESSFANCTFDEIIFPEELEEIEERAFFSDRPRYEKWQRLYPSYKKLEIPETVKRIGNSAFQGWLELEEITLPSGIEWFNKGVFYETAWYDSRPDGYIVLGDILYEYKGVAEENAVIEIPSNVKKIAGGAFDWKKTIAEIYIPDGVQLIGSMIFSGCRALSKIRLPADLTVIPDRAFTGCDSLESLMIPSSVKEIGSLALTSCSSLKYVYYEGTESDWEEGVKYINDKGEEIPKSILFSQDDTVVCYYSETAPETAGNYWHYVNNEPTLWQ